MQKPAHITVADDDPHELFFVERVLAEEIPGAKITTYAQLLHALHPIHTVATDLLITDHGMGEMSGTELIRELCK